MDPLTLVTLIAMAAVTYATRITGLLFGGRMTPTGRAKVAFDTIPAAVLIAVIAPTAFATGWAETMAALITALVATRLPLLATIAVGVVAVVILRALI